VLQEGELEISVSSDAGVCCNVNSFRAMHVDGLLTWVVLFPSGSMKSTEAGHPDILEVIKEGGAIMNGFLDLLAHLTGFPVSAYYSGGRIHLTHPAHAL
jgi:hypothetical protein